MSKQDVGLRVLVSVRVSVKINIETDFENNGRFFKIIHFKKIIMDFNDTYQRNFKVKYIERYFFLP